MAEAVSTPASQDDHMDLEDFKLALAKIPDEQREALVLTGGSGFSYEETAEICGCAVGTVKSRVNRARTALAGILGLALDRSQSRPIAAESTPAAREVLVDPSALNGLECLIRTEQGESSCQSEWKSPSSST
jgi:RNA polymerase sigma-70 factor (ECF subfamily)